MMEQATTHAQEEIDASTIKTELLVMQVFVKHGRWHNAAPKTCALIDWLNRKLKE